MTILDKITIHVINYKEMLTTQLTSKNIKQQGFTLIELLVVIGILAILMGIVLIAINPARQFAQANNTTRTNSVTQILNAIGQYSADNKGVLPVQITTTPQLIEKTGGADLCAVIIPTYMPSLPQDPSLNAGAQITDCSSSYNSGFQISKDANGRVTVTAPSAELSASISATR